MFTPGTKPGTYKLASSHDPAIAFPADATDEEKWKLLETARETGDWSALIVPGKAPTWYVMRWVPHATYERWWDARRERGGTMGQREAFVTLLLLALTDVENFGELRVRPAPSDRFRDTMVPESFLEEMRASLQTLGVPVSLVVVELATHVLMQEEHTGPKS